MVYTPIYPQINEVDEINSHNVKPAFYDMKRSRVPDVEDVVCVGNKFKNYTKINTEFNIMDDTKNIDSINDDDEGDDEEDDTDDLESVKPTAPLESRPNSVNFACRPQIKKKCRVSPIVMPSCLVLVSNMLVFSLLLWFRRFNTQRRSPFDIEILDLYRTLAKNSALMTILNLLGVFASLFIKTRRVHVIFVVWFLVFASMHVFGHMMLGIRYNITQYIKQNMSLTISGNVILVVLVPLCLSKCLRNYSNFYMIHIIFTIGLLISTITHSYWFAISFAYPLIVFVIRVLRRTVLNIELKPITVGETFILFELMIKDTFLNRCLALNYLKKHNGNAVCWISCKHANSIFERHPFSVLKTYNGYGQCKSQIIMSKFGDWKSNLYTLIRTNYSKSLYSCGVECYLDAFVTDENLIIFKNYSHILFILENLDVARFLSFVTLINDSKNHKLRTIVRQIELHFKFDDYLLHDIIREYTCRSLVNSHSSSFHLDISLYYVSDLNSPKLKNKIKSPYVHYITLKRLNYTHIVQNFVSRYYKDKLANKRATLKIVSSEERKVQRAVKYITSHKNPIIVI